MSNNVQCSLVHYTRSSRNNSKFPSLHGPQTGCQDHLTFCPGIQRPLCEAAHNSAQSDSNTWNRTASLLYAERLIGPRTTQRNKFYFCLAVFSL